MRTQDLELFVYETVQLDLSLLKTEQISVQFDEQINENVKLYEGENAYSNSNENSFSYCY